MYVLVIGLGAVGQHVAQTLALEGHDVTVIDRRPETIARAAEQMDVMALRGEGASMTTLREANAQNADIVLAVTDHDEANLLAAISAKELGAKKTVARISERSYFDTDTGIQHDLLGIDIVLCPEILTAFELVRLMRSMGAVAVDYFAENQIELLQLPVSQGSPVTKKPLKDLKIKDCLVAAVIRDHHVTIPHGEDVIEAGDEVVLIGLEAKLDQQRKLFGKQAKRATRRAMLVGGGEMGQEVARALSTHGVSVTLIDNRFERCEDLATRLSGVAVVWGSGTDTKLLQEEHVDNYDVFAALTHHDEVNLLASLLAKQLGANRVMALVHNPDLEKLYLQLGVNATVSPRAVVAEEILALVRPRGITGVHLLEGGKAEMLECRAKAGAPIVGPMVKDLKFPRGALIAAVFGKRIGVPRGDTIIQDGDTVVVFTLPGVRTDVMKMFEVA